MPSMRMPSIFSKASKSNRKAEIRRPLDVQSNVRSIGSQSLNHGITEIYGGGTKPVIDIIFVHGLTGNAFNTWYHESSETHWPADLLPKTFPEARVLTWGYDSNVIGFLKPIGQSRISNHAEQLVGDIVGERERSRIQDERPIVFVSHSLGGLVTELALTVSKGSRDKHLRAVERQCQGILFLGTPHGGADLASTLINVSRLTPGLGRPNKDIVGVLQPASEMLRQVERNFLILCEERNEGDRPLSIACCWEELEVAGLGFIVKQHQAELKPHNLIAIHANHMDMCKFSNLQDNGYLRVTDELRRWMQEISGESITAV